MPGIAQAIYDNGRRSPVQTLCECVREAVVFTSKKFLGEVMNVAATVKRLRTA